MTTHYGIIGCGMMGQEHLRNIRLMDDARAAIIYEPNARMAERAAGFAPEAVFASSMDALLEHAELDCLVLATPNYQHVGQLEQIAAKVSLPILCEKPLFTDPADAQRVARLARDYRAPIWVGMEYRYMPPLAAMIESAEEVTGGIKMLTIQEHRFPFLTKVDDWNRHNAKSGGTFVEKCCHFFDLMRHILQAEPVRVMSSAGQAVNHRDEVYDGVPSDIWDHGYVIVDFDDGTKAMLELCMFAEGSRFQEVISGIGPIGRIECAVPGPRVFWPAELGELPDAQVSILPRTKKGMRVDTYPLDPQISVAGGHYGSTYYQHLKFLDVVRGNGKVEVTLEDGRKAVEMGMAAQESARTGQAVVLT